MILKTKTSSKPRSISQDVSTSRKNTKSGNKGKLKPLTLRQKETIVGLLREESIRRLVEAARLVVQNVIGSEEQMYIDNLSEKLASFEADFFSDRAKLN